jgi:hypothetical protein
MSSLHLFSFFHLNLAFSSIEEEQRGDVIDKCYTPLLDLAQAHGPIGIEASGFTLEEIAARRPEWITRFRDLIGRGRAELIGAGYAQIIGPLVPARVTQENLKIGHDVYRALLGTVPRIALVNEQAYSAGLVGLYLDAGYDAILMDWDNPAAQHPEWNFETRFLPQRAVGADGRSIALLWTSTVAFQKLQRCVHGDMSLDEYCEYLRKQRGANPRTLCTYASDAEIFDFRPGRYKTEEAMSGSEWRTMHEAYARMAREPGCELVSPRGALNLTHAPHANQMLHLQSAACPVPVKKQRKYNLSRWAVTGRDDIGVNAACQRIYASLVKNGGDMDAWKELCFLWSSDFRTHITERRWAGFCSRLAKAEAQWAVPLAPTQSIHGTLSEARHLNVETGGVHARLDRRRGLALDHLRFAGNGSAIVGGLPHGHFDDIALQADWYTGDCVFEAPGEHKITDLEWCEARIAHEGNGDVIASALIATPRGPIIKIMRFHSAEPRVDFDITFDWVDWGRGALRLGHITLLPQAFDWDKLSLTTHNGGKDCETFLLSHETVDHGAPVSFLVSSSFGFGMSEGWAEIGDEATRIRVVVDRETAPLLGLLTHKTLGGSLFCQLVLSALELDETRKPTSYRDGPRRFRFSLMSAPAL